MLFRLNRNILLLYIDTLGLFKDIRKKAFIEALSNLIISLILVAVFDFGIYGILLGTFCSNMITNYFWEPSIIFNKGLKTSALKYHVIMIYRYFTIQFIYLLLVKINSDIVYNSDYLNFAIKLFIDSIIIVLITIILNQQYR